MSGVNHPDTIRLLGEVASRKVTVLVDLGSTHNFIDEKLVQKGKLSVINNKGLRVMVASGEFINCKGCCPKQKPKVEGLEIEPDLYMVPLEDSDIILGVQWLKPLGDVFMNFEHMTCKFSYQGNPVVWKGRTYSELRLIDAEELEKGIKKVTQMALIQVSG